MGNKYDVVEPRRAVLGENWTTNALSSVHDESYRLRKVSTMFNCIRVRQMAHQAL
jgi:hypothetical protein